MSETETTVPPMDDKALFDAAISDAPAQEAPAEAAPEQAQPEGEQPRDEHGRFAPKAEATEVEQAPAEQPKPAQPAPVEAKQDPPPGWIPAWRAREIADARVRELENKLRQLEKPQEPKDPYVDPEGFRDVGIREQVEPVRKELADTREWYSRELNIMKHGEETVQAAYQWLAQATQNGDPKVAPLLERVMKSINPFGDIVAAFKQHRAIATVGDDPQGWFKSQVTEWGKDPAKRAELMAMLGAQQQPNGAITSQSANVVKLPPSLNRQPGTAASTVVGDMSDQSLYEYATRR